MWKKYGSLYYIVEITRILLEYCTALLIETRYEAGNHLRGFEAAQELLVHPLRLAAEPLAHLSLAGGVSWSGLGLGLVISVEG